MGNGHALLIQWLFCERVASEDAALHAAQTIFANETLARDDLSVLMAEVRETLRPYHIDLRRVLSFDAQDSVWVLCNSLGDAIAQMASTYSPEEVRCFKKLIAFIAQSSRFQASTLDALLHIGGPLSKRQCEELIERLVDAHWLRKTPSGKLMIGPRTAAELEAFLRDGDLFRECLVCRGVVASACVQCGGDTCGALAHQVCLERMKRADPSFPCPDCRRDQWVDG